MAKKTYTLYNKEQMGVSANGVFTYPEKITCCPLVSPKRQKKITVAQRIRRPHQRCSAQSAFQTPKQTGE
jgi:hypothetical protein